MQKDDKVIYHNVECNLNNSWHETHETEQVTISMEAIEACPQVIRCNRTGQHGGKGHLLTILCQQERAEWPQELQEDNPLIIQLLHYVGHRALLLLDKIQDSFKTLNLCKEKYGPSDHQVVESTINKSNSHKVLEGTLNGQKNRDKLSNPDSTPLPQIKNQINYLNHLVIRDQILSWLKWIRKLDSVNRDHLEACIIMSLSPHYLVS